mmetsp:Transcript_89676/g.179187  ORF Transcript_89676/g.179187 Transcript_89676/m.179187 type:complete len:80 (-) Transcript_89676:137-376(-)
MNSPRLLKKIGQRANDEPLPSPSTNLGGYTTNAPIGQELRGSESTIPLLLRKGNAVAPPPQIMSKWGQMRLCTLTWTWI